MTSREEKGDFLFFYFMGVVGTSTPRPLPITEQLRHVPVSSAQYRAPSAATIQVLSRLAITGRKVTLAANCRVRRAWGARTWAMMTDTTRAHGR